MSELKTLKQIFEDEAAKLGVVVIRGDEREDAHVSLRKGEVEYVMLPGGETEDTTYAAGLHELGHIHCPGVDMEDLASRLARMTPLLPPEMYAQVLTHEEKAWAWARGALTAAGRADLVLFLNGEAKEALATYREGQVANDARWEKLVAEAMTTLKVSRKLASFAVNIFAVAEAKRHIERKVSTGSDGCGHCDVCKANAARMQRAKDRYAAATGKTAAA